MAMINPTITKWPRTRTRTVRWPWHHLGLGAILALAAALNLLFLGQNGYANTYYAAAVRSMLSSWHNFFYASFDPGGFVTIDKPPVAFWIQTASAWLFGYNGISLILPQALAGVGSVALLYHLVQRIWGKGAGLLAGLALALTPIVVAINRGNNPDPLLVLTLMLGAWAAIKATETGKLRWGLICGALVGVAFNIKMMQALIVVPAFGILYLFGARESWRHRLLVLGAALGALVVVGGSWATAVDLTPVSQRPYVGGSTTNSEWELIFGYNGLGRIFGQGLRGGSASTIRETATTLAPQASTAPISAAASTAMTPPSGTMGGPGGGMFGTGNPGFFRLVNQTLGGQLTWLLPLAIIGSGAAWGKRFRLPLTAKQQSIVLWAGWLLTHMVVFSFAQGILHSYYVVAAAPGLAALVGIGTVTLWNHYRQGGWHALLLPVALAVTTAYEIYLLLPYTSYSRWLIPIAVAGCIVSVAALLVGLYRRSSGSRWMYRMAAVGFLALLISPAVWSVSPLFSAIDGNSPSAGPQSAQRGFGGTAPGGGLVSGVNDTTTTAPNSTTSTTTTTSGPPTTDASAAGGTLTTTPAVIGQANGPMGQGGPEGSVISTDMLAYLEAHRNGATCLIAVQSGQQASSTIIATGESVMALGGFSGSDQILTLDQFKALVANNTVRYILLGGGRGGGTNSAEINQWVQANGKLVPTSDFSTSTTSTQTSNAQLYYLGS